MGCVALLVGCGGESKGGNTGKVNLKSNQYVGSLASIQANYDNSYKAAKEKIDKEKDAAFKSNSEGAYKKYAKKAEEYDSASAKNRRKYEADVKAEWAKINGKDVPVSMTDEFKKLNIDVSNVKFNADKQAITALITAKEDLKLNSMNGPDYEYANYLVLTKDGNVITSDAFFLLTTISVFNGVKYEKGKSLHFEGKEAQGNLNLHKNTEMWQDFAGIRFIAPSEKK
jgi:hypothetical protein